MDSQYPIGTVVWIEIPAADVQACASFYRNLFPSWEFKPATEQYPAERVTMFSLPNEGLTGGIVQVPAECKTREMKNGLGVTVYHKVESIEETQKQVEKLGGKSASEKHPEGENGWYMYFLDVEGNRFGVYEVQKKEAAA